MIMRMETCVVNRENLPNLSSYSYSPSSLSFDIFRKHRSKSVPATFIENVPTNSFTANFFRTIQHEAFV